MNYLEHFKAFKDLYLGLLYVISYVVVFFIVLYIKHFPYNKILRNFAILHIRWIQYRYKKITLSRQGTNQNIAILKLLQAKEYYYKQQFRPWGKFTPQCSFSDQEYKNHRAFMSWLFPQKDFEQWEILVMHHPESITYYQNKIFDLTKGYTPDFSKEILKQLKKWDITY